MKRFLAIALAASMGLVFAGTASAATVSTYAAGAAAGGIVGSKHNLGKFSSKVQAQGTTEVCVFCHTPHHADNTASYAPAPLWNRQKSASATYTAYGTTIGGSNITTVGGVSLACLSCHDGVTTFDNIINAPGPGMDGIAGGLAISNGITGAAAQGWTFVDGAYTGTGYSMGVLDGGTSVFNLGAGTGYTATNADLSNDHPISVCYSDGTAAGSCTDTTKRASLRDRTSVINSIDLTTGLALTAASEDLANQSQNRWAIKGFISSTATISDLLRNNKVECSSCHDPHFANQTSVTADQGFTSGVDGFDESGLFLRRVGGNVGSGVCRTCHAK